jgi:hypothetical protein
MKLKPGIYPGIPFDEYCAWKAVNNTLLEIIAEYTPAHAKAYLDTPPKETDALRIGHALHTKVLEPDKFKERYAIRPTCDRRTKEGKAVYEDFLKTLNGKAELTESEVAELEIMDKKLKSKGFVHNYVEKGQAEVCIVWQDARTDLLCKARLDYLQQRLNCIIDLKSTIKTAGYDHVSAAIARFGYAQQGAWYCDGLKTLTGEMPDFVFMFLEKKPPYECRAWQLADRDIIAGRKAYRRAMTIYADCVKTDTWPGWPDTVDIITMPEWALNKMGAGQYNLLSEEQENGPEKQYAGIDIDWDELGREAREEESAEGQS